MGRVAGVLHCTVQGKYQDARPYLALHSDSLVTVVQSTVVTLSCLSTCSDALCVLRLAVTRREETIRYYEAHTRRRRQLGKFHIDYGRERSGETSVTRRSRDAYCMVRTGEKQVVYLGLELGWPWARLLKQPLLGLVHIHGILVSFRSAGRVFSSFLFFFCPSSTPVEAVRCLPGQGQKGGQGAHLHILSS